MRRRARVVLLFGLAVLCAAGAWRSVRLALADYSGREDTVYALRRAAEIEPRDAALRFRLARLSGESVDPVLALRPRFTNAWLEQGLRAELRGDFAAAERACLHASRIDRTYAPRWALANFYFRRGDGARFWRAAGQAAQVRWADLSGLFALAAQREDGIAGLERILPADSGVQWRYLQFLVARGWLDSAAAPALRVAEWCDPAARELLLHYCDLALAGSRVELALPVWNTMARNGLIPYPDLAATNPLTNPDFATSPLGHGFDWRLHRPAGVTVACSGGELRLEFSGRQAEGVDLAEQFVPLEAGRRYRLRFVYRTDDLPPDTGLGLTVTGPAEPSLRLTAASAWSTAELGWTAAAPVARLIVRYRRPPGQSRAEGRLVLRGLTLAPAAGDSCP